VIGSGQRLRRLVTQGEVARVLALDVPPEQVARAFAAFFFFCQDDPGTDKRRLAEATRDALDLVLEQWPERAGSDR
jgi:hypothetical protein